MRPPVPTEPAAPEPPRRRPRVRDLTRLALVLAGAGASSIAASLVLRPETPPQPDSAPPSSIQALPPVEPPVEPPGEPPGETVRTPPPDPLPRAVPVRLTLSRVGIDTDLIPLGLNPDGTLQVPVPEADSPAGWYQGLASPGESGPAVIVGHVDAPGARAAFFNLGAVRAGDRIQVARGDGTAAEFVVDLVASFPSSEFPTAAVYGATDRPVLRLVTCGGTFVPGEGYDRSVVVFASMAPIPT
ncbi:MAG: class F sortase [Sporichthyaceae bacterium]